MPAPDSQAFLRELDKKLWTSADKLRSNLDAAVYKHSVLGLIFLKYVPDSFAQRQAELAVGYPPSGSASLTGLAGRQIEAMLKNPDSEYFLNPKDYGSAFSEEYTEAIRGELEKRDYYIEKNVFWVPPLARWKTLQDSAKLPAGTEIVVKGAQASCLFLPSEKATGKEKATGDIKATGKMPVLPYKITSTGKLIDDTLEAVEKENPKLKNVPVASVCDRRTLKSRIARHQPHDSRPNRLRTKPRKTSDGRRPTLQLQIDPANLAGLIDLIATIPFQHADLHAKDILGHRAKTSLSNSSSASLGGLCAFAVKNSSSANFAWVQHMLHHLAPNGSMTLLLANGSMSSNSSGEGDIRRALIEADLVDNMVALPGQLFTNTQIEACLN